MNPVTPEKLIAEALDPEWTHFVRCPHCWARTFACCEDHAIEGMREHIGTHHRAVAPVAQEVTR